MYAVPVDIPTTVFARLPDQFRDPSRPSAWVKRRQAGALHSFLEGPSFDGEGNLYCVDIPFGRIFRIDDKAQFSLVASYDGEPNGLKIHRDGRLFIADRQHGILSMNPDGSDQRTVVNQAAGKKFYGVNDLFFARDGSLYFTDQGDSSLEHPFGRVCRLAEGATEPEVLMENLAGPNGLVMNADETLLYVAVTRDNAIYSLPLSSDGGIHKAGRFIQLSGSPTGPDGLALDSDGNLAVVHAGFGTVWIFTSDGEPIFRVRSCAGKRTTNLAYGAINNRSLFITEAQDGVILRAELPVPGKLMFSHQRSNGVLPLREEAGG